MKEIILELLRKYGVFALLATPATFGIIVWLFAHVFAEPGTEVTVLWGMVKYTKGPEAQDPGPDDRKEPHRIRYDFITA